jgi:HK97 family phage major capsid protein
MSLSVGTGGAPMFFPAGGMTGSPTPNLLGRPVILSEKCQTLGTAGDIYLVDLSYYLVGDRQAMEMASSSHVRFNTDETDIRIIQRVDGRPWIDSALTPRNGSNTLSPFVALASRS